MDFYTFKTKVNLIEDSASFDKLMSTINFFTQQEILGEAHEDDGEFLYRFAVRHAVLDGREDELLEYLCAASDFTLENTKLVKAKRI